MSYSASTLKITPLNVQKMVDVVGIVDNKLHKKQFFRPLP